ncbi:CHAP domain-containing protein [Nonomuraea sp. NPDC047897]|uniref:CHAP domain-containing protein n=1 Tax=Nonomuraea sp. NPDC047897 TaxID=3364346 RepID=UPI0037240B31
MALDPIAEALLKQVRHELGYREKSGQHTKFGHWYAERVQDPQYRDAPWCDMFIAWAADKAGVADYVGQFAWTPSHAGWFIKQGAWSARPEPGALVFFDWKGGKSYKGVDHVGIVERVSGDKIHTIEANVDRVWLKRKVRETDKVVGYGLPRVVKANAQLTEIRSTEHPFAPAPRTRETGSPFDVLGTPQALLAAMVLTTIVLSLRFAGRRAVARPTAARSATAGSATGSPVTGSAVTGSAASESSGPGSPDAGSPAAPGVAGPGARAGEGEGRSAQEHAPHPVAVPRARVPTGAGSARTPSRRRPYEPKV